VTIEIKTAYNSTLAIGGVPSPRDSFVVGSSKVLGLNPDSFRDGENRHIRQARNRLLQPYTKKAENE
jgi:hypothetical protein